MISVSTRTTHQEIREISLRSRGSQENKVDESGHRVAAQSDIADNYQGILQRKHSKLQFAQASVSHNKIGLILFIQCILNNYYVCKT